MTFEVRVDPFPQRQEFAELWLSGWGQPLTGPLPNWSISLFHLGAYEDGKLVGYLNVATDGSGHAFLLDPTVHKDFQHRGVGTKLVKKAIEICRERGAHALHVDYEEHLDSFYRGCGFEPTKAGLIRLR
jgi:GNAT superfamily N-acetyltransferase